MRVVADEQVAAHLGRLRIQNNPRLVSLRGLETLRKHLGLDKEKRFTAVHHDMDHLFGRWSEAEFAAIQKKIDAESQVDAELWR